MDLNEYYAGWGTLALINSALGRCMMRSAWTWLFLSLFLGPFATAALAYLGPPDGSTRRFK
jgi:hypothetical protein